MFCEIKNLNENQIFANALDRQIRVNNKQSTFFVEALSLKPSTRMKGKLLIFLLLRQHKFIIN